MSQTFVSIFVLLLAQILPKLGVVVGDTELTTTLTTIITIVSSAWVLIRRHQVGDLTVTGMRK